MVTVRGYVGASVKAVVQFLAAAVTNTVSFRQSPLQPAKVDPAAGLGIRVMNVPPAKGAEQMAPQLIPAGREMTSPEPLPPLMTVTVPRLLNVAVHLLPVSDTVTLPELLQSPLQPANVDPPAGVGVRATVVPTAKGKEQVLPQLIPDGEEVTVPEPVPLFVTVRVPDETLKVAVQPLLPDTVTMRSEE